MQEKMGGYDYTTMMKYFSLLCILLVFGSSCAPNHKPVSKKDRQIIAVMTVIGAGIGAGIGAASANAMGDEASLAVGGAVAGAFAGYAVGHIVVEHMNQQEKEIRLSRAGKNGDIYIERIRPDVIKMTLEKGAEFPPASAELSPHGRNTLDDIARIVRQHEPSTVTIVAYSNDAPSSKANRDLSERRARTVADYLKLKGVGDSGIHSKGKGRPILLPASKTVQKNPWYRRIEIIVKGKETSNHS